MSASDPLKTVWSALADAGYAPHGQAWAFRSKCPAHDGDNPDSLSVSVGSDGRCLVCCHARACEVESIVDAVGLTVADLFPAGHRRARRVGMPEVARRDFKGPARDVAHVLYALEELDLGWRCEISMWCPACGDAAKLIASSLYDTFVSCPNFCTAEKVAEILAGKLADQRKVAR
jgi:hypothetical protein